MDSWFYKISVWISTFINVFLKNNERKIFDETCYSKKDVKYIKDVLETFMENDLATNRVIEKIDEVLKNREDQKEMKYHRNLVTEKL